MSSTASKHHHILRTLRAGQQHIRSCTVMKDLNSDHNHPSIKGGVAGDGPVKQLLTFVGTCLISAVYRRKGGYATTEEGYGKEHPAAVWVPLCARAVSRHPQIVPASTRSHKAPSLVPAQPNTPKACFSWNPSIPTGTVTIRAILQTVHSCPRPGRLTSGFQTCCDHRVLYCLSRQNRLRLDVSHKKLSDGLSRLLR